MRTTPTAYLVGSLFLATLCACQTSAEQPATRLDASTDAASPDAAADSGTPTDTGDDVGALDAKADPADTSSDTAEPIVFNPLLWERPNACEGVVSHPEPHDEFEVPHRPPDYNPILTREQVVATLGSLPSRGVSIRASADLQPGAGWPYDFYVQPGTDVRLHLYVLNGKDDLSSFRISATVLVDYQPVDATYTRWNADRSEKVFEKKTTGVNFPVESGVELIDVTIPAEAFPEMRMYEIALSLQTTSDEYTYSSANTRFALYNGGYQFPDRPCSEPRLNAHVTEIERLLRTRTVFGILFFEGITDRNQINETIEVAPGETKRLFFSMPRSTVDNGPKSTVAVPTFNGRPMGPVWWLTQGSDTRSDYYSKIDARKTFEVTFPEEPGIYEVQVNTWLDPFRMWRNRNGIRVQGVTDGSVLYDSSNPLRFRVVAPDSP